MQILVEKLVFQKQVSLVKALMSKGYFATEAAAQNYRQKIVDFIATIPDQTHRKTKDKSFEAFYATYKANRHTTWYILFDIKEDTYIIRNLINNHTPDYPQLIAGFLGK